MSAFCQAYRDALLAHSLANTQHTTPGTVFMALHGVAAGSGSPTDPGEDPAKQGDGGSTELDWTSYERQLITFGATTQESGKSQKKNDNVPTFPPVDTGEGPYTVTGFSIWSDTLASGGGYAMFKQAVDNVKTLNQSDVISFPVGSITARLD